MNAKECSNYHTIALISQASKIMLKILQAMLQQYLNQELQMYKPSLEKAEEPEIKLPTPSGSQKKARELKKIYFCFIDYAKAFVWITTNCGKFLKRWEYPRNLYAGQDGRVSTAHGTIRSDQISRSVVSDSLPPHESQHARPPCPSPTPGVHSNSHTLSQ